MDTPPLLFWMLCVPYDVGVDGKQMGLVCYLWDTPEVNYYFFHLFLFYVYGCFIHMSVQHKSIVPTGARRELDAVGLEL